MSDQNIQQNVTSKWIGYAVGIGLGGYLLWSIIFETLLPLWQNGSYLDFWLNVLGIPFMLLGTGLLVYGGWIFLRDTLRFFAGGQVFDDVLSAGGATLGPKSSRQHTLQLLWEVWRPSFGWLGSGIVALVIGIVLVDYVRNSGG